jgi:hypothetical protein
MLLLGMWRCPSNGFLRSERLYGDRGEFHGGYGWPDLGNSSVSVAAELAATVAAYQAAADERREDRDSCASARTRGLLF